MSASASHWYALHVKPHHEKRVASALREKGREEFLPLYKQQSRWSDRYKEICRPLFPGYTFLRARPAELAYVTGICGVLRVVGSGSRPLPVEEYEIEAIRTIVGSGLPMSPWPRLAAGDPVVVIAGPLRGTKGFMQRRQSERRLVVTVTLLNRSVSVEVERSWVMPLRPVGRFAASFYPNRLRSTLHG